MKRKIIRLTEQDLNNIIIESVERLFDSEPSYTQLKNILGVHDNDEWNAAADAERKEEVEGQIFNALKQLANGNPRKNPFNFKDAIKMLNDKFGFKYVGPDDDDESHIFRNGNDELTIYPTNYYPSQGMTTLYNIHLN